MAEYYKDVHGQHKPHRRAAIEEPLTLKAVTHAIYMAFLGVTKKCSVGCDPVQDGSQYK
jgi:hypothetical protein